MERITFEFPLSVASVDAIINANREERKHALSLMRKGVKSRERTLEQILPDQRAWVERLTSLTAVARLVRDEQDLRDALATHPFERLSISIAQEMEWYRKDGWDNDQESRVELVVRIKKLVLENQYRRAFEVAFSGSLDRLPARPEDGPLGSPQQGLPPLLDMREDMWSDVYMHTL